MVRTDAAPVDRLLQQAFKNCFCWKCKKNVTEIRMRDRLEGVHAGIIFTVLCHGEESEFSVDTRVLLYSDYTIEPTYFFKE